jgi:GDP-L-fucose synthase
MNRNDKVYVAGHRGLVGSAIVRALREAGYGNLLLRTSEQVDLRSQADTFRLFEEQKPDYVFLAAAKVGGILANATYKAEFIYDNLMIAANVVEASRRCGVRKLLNLASSCIYPRLAPQPLEEDSLLTGVLEPTHEAYAIAKIAALKLCRFYNEQHGTNYVTAMPSNIYGPNDNFDPETSHVLPALIRKIHDAKAAGRAAVLLWGDGTPTREFLFNEDLAQGLLFIMKRLDSGDVADFVNIGTGEEITIKALAKLIAEIVGYDGSFEWDTSKPNGTPRKVLDISRLSRSGWRATTTLRDGIEKTYSWFQENVASHP